MRRLLLCFCFLLSACAAPRVTEPARVQCFAEGEVIFDYTFDRAETAPDGSLVVWHAGQRASINGADCRVVGE